MSFKTDMQEMAVDLINTVFGSEGNISKTVTIMHPMLANIDVASDTLETNYDSFLINGVLGPWKKDAISSQGGNKTQVNGKAVKTDDQSLKVAFTDLEFTPTVDIDTVSLTDGSVYLIIFTVTDAADAVMTMQLRRIKGLTNV